METNTKERIYVSKEYIDDVLTVVRSIDHVRRYQLIKRFCYGKVLDAACGVGYGSYLLSNNPDISEVIGIDISSDAICHAKQEFKSPKIKFLQKSIIDLDEPCDTFVSLETLEHIQEVDDFVKAVERCQPNVLIVSFPDKKSTHFNEFHFHDFKKQDLINLFGGYAMVREIFENDVYVLVFVKIASTIPTHIFR